MINSTNDKIRYTSFRFFLEKGYEATNIRDICKEVDIKPSSLYFYYKSKQELFFSIYDDIWDKKIKYMADIEELKQDISPKMKLYYLYKAIMEYNSKDITQQKFLLRYHLFPAEEITPLIREKFNFRTNKENKLILDIIKQCMERNILDGNKSPNDYLQAYKSFEKYQTTEMIISSIKVSSKAHDMLWLRFWNCNMLSDL